MTRSNPSLSVVSEQPLAPGRSGTADRGIAGVFRSDDDRWRAVEERRVDADGQFVYSVRSTGIYCKPSCPSRPKRRANVAFHAGPAEARAAGFRACKRCRPDAAGNTPEDDAGSALVARACALIAAAEEAPSLEALAAAVGLSPFQLHRLFKSVTGVTPKAYAAAERARRLRQGLDSDTSITTAIYDAGYNSSSRYYETAGARLGMRASDVRKRAAGQSIRFAIGDCSLGCILVAATERGICAIEFADRPETLVERLQQRFAEANLVGGDADFEATVASVVAAVEMPARAASLPLDIRGTAFQERVWQALRAIPPGTTATYAEVAARIGLPASTRAVANACGANGLAVAIPCHRVVRTNGGLGGYRWGIERKEQLLALERTQQEG